jgi:hypothetical protein
MNFKEANKIVNDALCEWSGFTVVTPEELKQTCAGNVKFNGWTKVELFAYFDLMLTSNLRGN